MELKCSHPHIQSLFIYRAQWTRDEERRIKPVSSSLQTSSKHMEGVRFGYHESLSIQKQLRLIIFSEPIELIWWTSIRQRWHESGRNILKSWYISGPDSRLNRWWGQTSARLNKLFIHLDRIKTRRDVSLALLGPPMKVLAGLSSSRHLLLS